MSSLQACFGVRYRLPPLDGREEREVVEFANLYHPLMTLAHRDYAKVKTDDAPEDQG